MQGCGPQERRLLRGWLSYRLAAIPSKDVFVNNGLKFLMKEKSKHVNACFIFNLIKHLICREGLTFLLFTGNLKRIQWYKNKFYKMGFMRKC